jgi:hypothetical protein
MRGKSSPRLNVQKDLQKVVAKGPQTSSKRSQHQFGPPNEH